MNVMPSKTVLLRQAAGNRSIGAILVDAGRLTLEDAERILTLQQNEGLRFGDAGIKLGALKPEDISFALARQFDYPYLLAGESNVARVIVAAYEPFSVEVEALRALRSQLMMRWFTGEREKRTLAIASPGRGEGRSWLAANLAVVFSQLGEHTLLIDGDLRNPSQHSLFGIENRSGLSSILSNRGQADTIQRIDSFVDLSVLPSGPLPPNPQELLGRPPFARLLDELAGEFGVIIIDTPAATEFADTQTIATRSSGALLLARKHRTIVSALGSLTDNLRQTGVQVVGSIVTEF
jgi:receptor protein-tyrosine kinase